MCSLDIIGKRGGVYKMLVKINDNRIVNLGNMDILEIVSDIAKSIYLEESDSSRKSIYTYTVAGFRSTRKGFIRTDIKRFDTRLDAQVFLNKVLKAWAEGQRLFILGIDDE